VFFFLFFFFFFSARGRRLHDDRGCHPRRSRIRRAHVQRRRRRRWSITTDRLLPREALLRLILSLSFVVGEIFQPPRDLSRRPSRRWWCGHFLKWIFKLSSDGKKSLLRKREQREKTRKNRSLKERLGYRLSLVSSGSR